MEIKNKGFTLIEISVAVGIFSLAITALFGFFVQSIKGQQRALATEETVDNVSYSMEYISRALRMAKKDDIGGIDCLTGDKVNYEVTNGGQGIKFRNYKDECQEFFLESERLKERKSSGGIETEAFFTAVNVRVNMFNVSPSGSWDQDDNEQPIVTLYLDATNKNGAAGESPVDLRIQTTISQRNLDVRR